MLVRTGLFTLCVLLFACGPTGRPNGGDDHGSVDSNDNGNCATPSAENTPAACSDGIDNDCDGVTDCSDPDCSGIGNCPVCGMVQHPTGAPVSLPDGIIGAACTSDAQCSGSTPSCVEMECHGSYTSKLNFTGFGSTQKLMMVSDIQSVCVNISHSWIRDLEISLRAPSGELLIMDKFQGRTGGEVFVGHAIDPTDCPSCTPEAGADYCWKPTATNIAMLPFADAGVGMMSWNGHTELPPGDYQSSDPWTKLIGAQLNGDWTIVVTDLWPIDDGVIHQWSIAFNPAIVQDCSGPVIQ